MTPHKLAMGSPNRACPVGGLSGELREVASLRLSKLAAVPHLGARARRRRACAGSTKVDAVLRRGALNLIVAWGDSH